MQRVTLVHSVLAIFLLPGKILFDDEPAVLDDQDAVNVFVNVVPDLREQVLDEKVSTSTQRALAAERYYWDKSAVSC